MVKKSPLCIGDGYNLSRGFYIFIEGLIRFVRYRLSFEAFQEDNSLVSCLDSFDFILPVVVFSLVSPAKRWQTSLISSPQGVLLVRLSASQRL